MAKKNKNVSIMCFHDELCQVYNALATALNLLREGSKVTVFFASRGINAVHKERVKELKCMPDMPEEVNEAVMNRMKEMNLPTVEDLLTILIAEGATILACQLNISLFGMTYDDLVDGVEIDNPTTYYKKVVIQADMNLTF